MKTIALPIARGYVANWGIWEAIRELIQNALDQDTCSVQYDWNVPGITVSSTGGKMEEQSLLLGATSKADDANARGKFGEGFKLAMLVLVRNGIDVDIRNGRDVWEFTFDNHPELGVECLTVTIQENYYPSSWADDEVHFRLKGLSTDTLHEVQDKYLVKEDLNVVASSGGSYAFESEQSCVYVGGLFVAVLSKDSDREFRYSYNFEPHIVSLDRDRSFVSSFDISYEATRMYNDAGDFDLIVYLASEGFADVNDYVTIRSGSGYGEDTYKIDEKIAKDSLAAFYKKHGEKAFPIDKNAGSAKTHEQTKRAIKKGLIPIPVHRAFYKLFDRNQLREMLAGTEIKEAHVLLEEFLLNNKKHMRSRAKKGLLKIIQELRERSEGV